jgi:hypothetical protein
VSLCVFRALSPGLILELQEFKTVYYASAINILKDKIIDFPKGK